MTAGTKENQRSDEVQGKYEADSSSDEEVVDKSKKNKLNWKSLTKKPIAPPDALGCIDIQTHKGYIKDVIKHNKNPRNAYQEQSRQFFLNRHSKENKK